MRPVRFLGDSLKSLRDFPEDARHDMGYQLDKVQRGEQPDDFKPMPGVGRGVEELVYVLHAFRKKTQATPKRDLEIVKNRFGQMLGGRK